MHALQWLNTIVYMQYGGHITEYKHVAKWHKFVPHLSFIPCNILPPKVYKLSYSL